MQHVVIVQSQAKTPYLQTVQHSCSLSIVLVNLKGQVLGLYLEQPELL
jgi:hypothetical protein